MAFNTFAKQSGVNKSVCFEGTVRQNVSANNRFIMNVLEEDRRSKILEDVFLRSSKENSYLSDINANISLCKAIVEENRATQITARRKMVRRAHEDIRELENKLKSTVTSWTGAAQKFEANQLLKEERFKSLSENQELNSALLYNPEHNKTDQVKMQEVEKFLQAQMALTEEKRRRERQAKLDDKKRMEEAVKKYKEDLLKYEIDLKEKKKKNWNDMKNFEAIQEKFRQDSRAAAEQEMQKADEVLAQQEEEYRKVLQKRKEIKKQKALISERMGEENHKAAELKSKSFDVLIDLLTDERNANEDMKFARENEKKFRERLIYRNDLINQFKRNEKKKNDEKLRDEKFYREVLREQEEQDKKYKLTKLDKKKQKAEAHRIGLLNSLKERKNLRAKEMMSLKALDKYARGDEQRKEVAVEHLRNEIINEHMSVIKGARHVAPKGNKDTKKT